MKAKHKNIWGILIVGLTLAAVLVVLLVNWKNITQEKTYHVVLIPKVIDEDNDFWTSLIEGAKMAAQEYGVEMEVVAGPTEEDYEYQNQLIEQAIEQKPDAILITPCSFTENTEVIKKAKEAGIKVGLIDSVVDEPVQDLIVATDNISAGEKLGEYVMTLKKDEDPCIAIVGHVEGASTAIDREIGVKEGLGQYKDNVVDVVFCGSAYGRAYDLTIELMEKYPELDTLIGLNEYSAVGMARAVRDTGKQDDINLVGFDSSIEEIQLMEGGIFKGIVIQKPFNMGYLGVEQMVNLLEGKSVEENLDSGSKLITMSNLYTEENQKLLFPFVG